MAKMKQNQINGTPHRQSSPRGLAGLLLGLFILLPVTGAFATTPIATTPYVCKNQNGVIVADSNCGGSRAPVTGPGTMTCGPTADTACTLAFMDASAQVPHPAGTCVYKTPAGWDTSPPISYTRLYNANGTQAPDGATGSTTTTVPFGTYNVVYMIVSSGLNVKTHTTDIGAANQQAGNATAICSNGVLTSCTYTQGHLCFLPDTQITLADGRHKEVKDLQAGDRVQGRGRINTVLSVPNYDTDQAVYGFNGGKAFVTGGHPFMTQDGWKAIDPRLTPKEGHAVKVGKLEVGDVLSMEDYTSLKITSIDRTYNGAQHVFNPKLDGDHTYYANGKLVHNK